MTFGKEFIRNSALHVPHIRKSKLVFVLGKFVLTKNNMYVGKSHLCDGLFKMNMLTIVSNNSNSKVFSFAYTLEPSNLLHHQLGHAKFNFVQS